jgi:hypothetical protein
MSNRRRWREIVSWVVLTVLAMVWAVTQSSTWSLRLIHFVSYMAIFLAASYLPPLLSVLWRIVFFGIAIGLAVLLLWMRQDSYFPIIAGTMFSFLMPVRWGSQMTIREALRYFRNSRQREEEAAKAIIAQHLKDVSRGSIF